MSLLDVGKSCTVCSTVDFLPFTCPHCQQTLCRAHVQRHQCTSAHASSEASAMAGPSTFRRKTQCALEGCDRPSIEAIGGKEGNDDLLSEDIARQVRCAECGGAYCTTHRAQVAHSCSAPLDFNARNDALSERRARAKQLIAQKFPGHKDRVIPKPPPQRDVIKIRPESPERTPPSLQQTPFTNDNSPGPPRPAKSKAEKLRELEIRKLRSLAKPLDPQLRADGERRFLEWGMGGREDVKGWQGGGKLGLKLEKVWVPQDVPVGRILDIIIDRSKTPRPPNPTPESILQLICLSRDAAETRGVRVMSNDKPASDFEEGGVVLLVQGWD